MLATQGDLLGKVRDEQIQKGKGNRGIRPGTKRSRRAQPMAALRAGVEGQSQVSFPPPAPSPCECSSVAGEACPARHITLQGSALAEVKNTTGSKNGTEAAAQRVLLSLLSRPTSLPSTETGKASDWGGGEGLSPRGRAGE